MIKSKKIAILSLIIVFVTGILCGILTERLVIQKITHNNDRQNSPPPFVQIFKKELDLNPEQEETLKQLLADIRARHKDLRDRQVTVYDSLRHNFDENFKAILDAEQQQKFAVLQEKWREQRKRHR